MAIFSILRRQSNMFTFSMCAQLSTYSYSIFKLSATVLLLNLFCLQVSANGCCCGIDDEIEVPGGDFEFAPFPGPGGWIDTGAPGTVGPWDIIFGSISHHDDAHNGLGNGNPNPSTAHLDLNGWSMGGVCQDISGFTPGNQYTLVFYYSIHNGTSSATAAVEIDGGDALDEEWTATNQGQIEWLEACYSFTATSATMSLCFSSQGGIPCCGMLIDDIEIFSCFVDEELPTMTNSPVDLVLQCIDEVPDVEDLDISDNCDGDIEIDFEEQLDDSDPCMTTITRIWTIVDGCGNELEYVQNILVSDTESPVLEDDPLNLFVECLFDLSDELTDWIDDLAEADLSDNCSEVSLIIDESQIDFNNCGTYPLNLIYVDECGNEMISSANVIVEDTFEPIFEVVPEDLYISCDDDKLDLINDWVEDFGDASVFDLCDLDFQVDYDPSCETDQLVSFIAEDQCGNISIATANIYINLDTLIYIIDTFTCDPNHVEQIEIFSPSDQSCDTLIILEFDLLASDTMIIDSIWCDGINSYLDTLRFNNQQGCDSLVIYNIVAINSESTILIESTCNMEEVGIDTVFEQSIYACDSLVITQTEFSLNDTIVDVIYICDLELPTEEIVVIPGPICDSVFVFQSFPILSDSISIQDFSCNAQDTGSFISYDINVNGCDSTTYLSISYQPLEPVFFESYTCDPNEVSIDTIVDSTGACDSTFIEQILLLESDTSWIDIETCWPNAPSDTLWITNLNGCDSIIINQYNYIALEFEYYVELDPCGELSIAEIEITEEQGGELPYQYTIDGVNFSDEPIFGSLEEGDYVLQIQDSQGCVSEEQLVTIEDVQEIEILVDSILVVDENSFTHLNILIEGEYQDFYWSDSSVLSCDDCLSPVVTITEDIVLTLFVLDQYGCIYSNDIILLFNSESEEEETETFILVPNVFSPNGDGLNDVFNVFVSEDIQLRSMNIYNRWGNEVFKSQATLDGLKAWDGLFQGVMLNPDVFVYRIYYLDEFDREQVLIGDVTLVK